MLENLSCTCEANDCDRPLGVEQCMLAYRTDGGVRRAYECECGQVTITVTSSE